MASPKLHTDSLQLNAAAPGRHHSALKVVLVKGIDELMRGGLVVKEGAQWKASGAVVAEEFTYTDSVQRTQKALRFSSWMCLALALKLSREADRQALMDAVQKHPIY